MTLTFGSLFAGIGGFDLGLERAGLVCAWQVESDPYCRRVLEKHWPGVRRHDDVRSFPPRPVQPIANWRVDVLCGGFPCQDVSNAGKRAGIGGARSGLWGEFFRIIRLLRPRFILVENTASIAGRGLGRVLGDLATLGLDAEWSVVPACALGAPHTRERMFVLAHAEGERWQQRWWQQWEEIGHPERHLCHWPGQPEPLRVAPGLPDRLDRNHCLGNTVMPQVTELIGRVLLATLAGADP